MPAPLFPWFMKFSLALQQALRPRRKVTPPRARLMLQALEDRELLATWLWVGPDDGTWSTPGNWKNIVGGGTGVPGNQDTALFNPNLSVGGTPGTNTHSKFNLGNFSLANLTITSHFTDGKIDFITGNDELTITGSESVRK